MIQRIYEIDWNSSLESQFKDIFFTSSTRKSFSSPEEKSNFYHSWTHYYFKHCPDEILLAIDPASERLMGYLTGCCNSHLSLTYFRSLRSSEDLFSDLFEKYPAHLHINCHPDFRGKGIGSELVCNYCNELTIDGVKGLHIVTSPESANVNFYRKNGFNFESHRNFNGSDLLFMGRSLEVSKSTARPAPSLEHLQI